MPPDFLLECTACGTEAVWDTDAVPPVGLPEVGHPVLWFCETCGRQTRHTIVDLYVLIDKLHREICVATELDRETVDRVMTQVYRHRQAASDEMPSVCLDAAQKVEDVPEAALDAPPRVHRGMSRRCVRLEGGKRLSGADRSARGGIRPGRPGKHARGEGNAPHPAGDPGPGSGWSGLTSCCASRWARSRGWPRRCRPAAAARSSAPGR